MSESPYRARRPVEPDPYLVAWAKLQRLDAWRKRVSALYLPFMVYLVLPSSTLSVVIFLIGTLTNVFGGVSLYRRMKRFACPRCGKPFFGVNVYQSRKNWACQHCGILFGTSMSASLAERVRVDSTLASTAAVDAPNVAVPEEQGAMDPATEILGRRE